jgi:hypothetical protein
MHRAGGVSNQIVSDFDTAVMRSDPLVDRELRNDACDFVKIRVVV